MASPLACPICASPVREVLWPSARLPDAATVVRCTSCRFIYRSEDITSSDQPALTHTFTETDVPWRWRLEAMEEAGGCCTLLNVGSGPLPFLQLARDAGWQVSEIDPNLLQSGEINPSEGRWPAGSFDAVTIWSGLEYSARPASLITLAAHYLRVDGMLAVQLLIPEQMAEQWPALLAVHADTPPPARLFTPVALQRFLGRYGFRIERSLPGQKSAVALLARYVP